jgi:proline dehydrogenase
LLRRALLAVSSSERIREIVTTAPYTRDVVARFVAGAGQDDALRVTRQLLGQGLLVSLDHLGEDTKDPEQAAAATEEYISLLGRLAAEGHASGGAAEVSVKPTAVGLRLPEHGEKTARENIVKICTAARAAATTVTVDMEDHDIVDPVLRMVRELREDFADLGCVIQSYLRRSEADCAALAEEGVRVRLCKGAYDAPEPVGFASRADVDRSYVRCLNQLLNGRGYPMVATHDPRLIEITTARAILAGRAVTGFEYQMLYGIRPAEQRRLAATGARMRIYVPYGSDWYGYLTRRLAERPANLTFFLRSLVSRK